jgi:hypothetical protein
MSKARQQQQQTATSRERKQKKKKKKKECIEEKRVCYGDIQVFFPTRSIES